MGEKTELKKEQKKQKLLDAAYSLFLEKGVSKTSVDEIAKGANVAKGTFYLYFHDKEHLLQQLAYQISFRVLSEGYEFVNARQTKDFTENVILLIDYDPAKFLLAHCGTAAEPAGGSSLGQADDRRGTKRYRPGQNGGRTL